ncbi:MAG: hypothetical protein AAF481_06080 [Acidobacteriota bacterium]
MRYSTRGLLFVVLALVCVLPAAAFVEPTHTSELDGLQKRDPGMGEGRQVASLAEVQSLLAESDTWANYAATLGPRKEVYFDLGTGEPAMVKGAPVAMIPGRGNDLTLDSLSARAGQRIAEVDEAVVTGAIDAFLDDHSKLLAVPRFEIAHRSTDQINDHMWLVTYEHRPWNVPVFSSRLTFVIGHGNLILWGSEDFFPLAAGAATEPRVDEIQAKTFVENYVQWDTKRDRWDTEPELLYLPRKTGLGALSAELPGKSHRLVWEMIFRRQGVIGTWLAHLDASTGEVLQFADINQYGWVRGGIEPNTWTDTEENRPLPLVNLSTAGFTSIESLHTEAGPFDASLDGELTRIQDQCGGVGFPVLAADGNDNVNFGSGPPNPDGDADCTTNGIGGQHNTHAARSAYYHITRLKDKGRSWLPANTWLDSSHDVRVNIEDTCNAYWSPGGGFNGFFQEGFNTQLNLLCWNTGEVAAIFQHEVGHGLDQNDAQGTADGGTGETYADTLAMFDRHESCMGPSFWDRMCPSYGFPCTECSGVRDQDYAKHVDSGGVPVTTPFTPDNFTRTCPGPGFSAGPCGRQVHCESMPAGGAMWDLAVRKLAPALDIDSAWLIAERTWMLAMQTSTAMFNCNSGTFVSDGCAATSWFQGLLAADDDNGDLTDGTPHAAFLFEAFNDHAIACGSVGDAGNQNSSACAALATPAVTATAAASTIDLSWPAVTNAQGYAVLKNHGECNRGYQQAANLGSGATSFSDPDVVDNQSYSYRVVALGAAGDLASNSCYSDISNCAEATISSCPAAIASAPALATPADNEVTVSWDDSGTCSGFNLYRQQGGCAAGGGFLQVANNESTSPYTDNAVSGGITYGYRLSALDPSGSFETGQSPCAEITPTGQCNEIPTFDSSAVTAENRENVECGVTLDWTAGATTCPAQAVVYNVYRSTIPGFEPGDANRIASNLAATTYLDTDVDSDVEYFYTVRAEALSGLGGGPNGGVEDTNSNEVSAVPTGPFSPLFEDDLESGSGQWASTTGPTDETTPAWALVTDDSNSPPTAWFAPDTADVGDQRIEFLADVGITSGAGLLRFWHHYNTEATFDGGVLEYSTDGGTSWFDILAGNGGSVPDNGDRFLANGYDNTIRATATTNPVAGRDAWSGDGGTTFLQVIVDLGDFDGETVRFRWRMTSDTSVSRDGWWVDDVEVVQGSMCNDDSLIFADGFESGDTLSWSDTID